MLKIYCLSTGNGLSWWALLVKLLSVPPNTFGAMPSMVRVIAWWRHDTGVETQAHTHIKIPSSVRFGYMEPVNRCKMYKYWCQIGEFLSPVAIIFDNLHVMTMSGNYFKWKRLGISMPGDAFWRLWNFVIIDSGNSLCPFRRLPESVWTYCHLNILRNRNEIIILIKCTWNCLLSIHRYFGP